MNDTEHAAERVSCLVDGELHGAEFGRAVDAIASDAEQKRRWTRYHIATDAMKKSLPPAIEMSDFADRVMQAIESEPTILAPQRSVSRSTVLRKPVAGFAVAASVTAIMVLGARNFMVAGDAVAPLAQGNQVETAQVANAAAVPGNTVVTVAAEQQAIPPNVQSQLNRYLLNHNQNAVGMHGMLPYARIVGYSAGESGE